MDCILYHRSFISHLNRFFSLVTIVVYLSSFIPNDLIIAGIEVFVAVLLALIPSGYTQGAAGILMTDALVRGSGSLKELSEINKNRPASLTDIP